MDWHSAVLHKDSSGQHLDIYHLPHTNNVFYNLGVSPKLRKLFVIVFGDWRLFPLIIIFILWQ